MARNNKKAETVSTEVTEVKNSLVLVRVIRNFNDATDGNNFVSAGANTFYRTTKERADMLVAAGYAEYEEVKADIITEVNDSVDIDTEIEEGTADDTNTDADTENEEGNDSDTETTTSNDGTVINPDESPNE